MAATKKKGKKTSADPPFPTLLHALRTLKAQGAGGFEGLVRDCIEAITGQRIRLVKSGPQDGRDLSNDPGAGPRLMVEAKRFGEDTALPRDELKSKLIEAIESAEAIDIWAVALSQEMKQPDWGQLGQIAAGRGVEILALDWRPEPGTLPTLAVICAAGRWIIAARLPGVPASLFDEIEGHPLYESTLAGLHNQLTSPLAGYGLAANRTAHWLEERLSSRSAAKATFRSNAGVLAPDSHHVDRQGVVSQLDAWWAASSSPPAVLLAEEGRGKSWAALAWAARLAKRDIAPLVLAVAAKDLESPDPAKVLAAALRRTLPAGGEHAVDLRMDRWVRNGGRIVLLIDGLNERFDFDWRELLDRLAKDPWKNSVAVLLTCRRGYWDWHLGGLQRSTDETPILRIEVPPFTPEEIDRYLATFGLARSDVPASLLQLIAIPRFAQLALSLKDRWHAAHDFSVAGLVLEDWRARIKQGLDSRVSDEQLRTFVADLGRSALAKPDLSVSTAEIHRQLSADSGAPITDYQRAINELVEGLWLESAGAPDRYKPNEKLLPIAIGLHLANRVAATHDRAGADEVIAESLEQLNGADIGVAILRAATTLTFLTGTSGPFARSALLESWLKSQNFSNRDFVEFWPLAVREPALFLDLAERLLEGAPLPHGETEVLLKTLANAAENDGARPFIADRLIRWCGRYALDPYQLIYGREVPQSDVRQAATRERLDAWTVLDSAYARRFAALMTPASHSRLPTAAFAIISCNARAPFADALALWAMSRAIMDDFRGLDDFHWVVRLNRVDPQAMHDALLAHIAELTALNHPVATEARDALAKALSRPTDSPPVAKRAAARAMPFHAKAPEQILASFEKRALDPSENLSEKEHDRVRLAALNFTEGATILDSASSLGPAMIALARWQPIELATWLRAEYVRVPVPPANQFNRALNRLQHSLAALPEEMRRSYLEPALAAFAANRSDSAKAVHYRAFAFVGMLGLPAREQIEILRQIEPFAIDDALAGHLSRPSTEEVEPIFERLNHEADPAVIAGWLGYLIYLYRWPEEAPAPRGAEVVVRLSSHENQMVRTAAMWLIRALDDPAMGHAFADSPWAHKKGQEVGEAFHGTRLLCKFGKHLAFNFLRTRIIPQALGALVEARGCEQSEVRVLFESWMDDLDDYVAHRRRERYSYVQPFEAKKAWLQVARMNDCAAIAKLEQAVATGRVHSFLSFLPLEEFLEAAFEVSPARAAAIWQRIRASEEKDGVRSDDLDGLTFESRAPETSPLRLQIWNEARTDQAIEHLVGVALESESQAWLLDRIRRSLSDVSPGEVAKALTAAGFLDDTPESLELWQRDIEPQPLGGWLSEVRDRARANLRTHLAARHWFDELLNAQDRDQVFALRILFDATADGRFWMRGQGRLDALRASDPALGDERVRDLVDSKPERKQRREGLRTERQKTLFGEKVGSLVWPWL